MKNVLLFTLLITTIISFAQAPGGVSNNIVLWVKADDLTLNTGDNVSLWNDASGGNNANQTNLINQPTHNEVVQNYNPGVYFDKNNRYLDIPNLIAPNATSINIFAIGTNELGPNNTGFRAMVFGQGENGWSSGGYCLCTTNNSNTSFGVWMNTYSTRVETVWFGGTQMPARILEGKYDGTDVTFYLDAQNRGQTPYTGIVGVGGTGTGTTHLGGGDRESNSYKGHISEVIIYSSALSNADRNKINSYLAIKYGISGISRSGIEGSIVNSGGQPLFSATTYEYWRDVIGIGRDNASALYQKQSHVNSDNTRIYLDNLAIDNLSNTGVFADNQFVIMGRNNGISSPINNLPSIESPASVITRIEREYKITNTNFTNTFSVDIRLNDCIDTSQIDVNDLRLLVDDDGDFTDATVYASGDNGLSIVLDGDYIKFIDIANAHIPSNSTRYITLASTTLASLNILITANDVDDISVCDLLDDGLADGIESFPIDIGLIESQIIGAQTDVDDVEFFDENGLSLNLTNPYTNSTPFTETITVRINHNDGCYAETTFDLIALPIPIIDTQDDLIECSNFTLPPITGVNLSENEAYYTEPDFGGTSYNSGDTLDFSDFASYPITMYIADENSAGICPNEVSFQLTIQELPEIDDLDDVIICGTYTLPPITGNVLSGNQAYYTMPNGEGISFLEGHQFDYQDILSFPITFYIYDYFGSSVICSDEESFELIIYNSIDFELTESNLDINFIGTMIVNMEDNSVNYEYAVDNLDYQTDNVFIDLQEGTHTLFVRDENECIIKSIEFEIEIIYSIIPLFFTPNGDRINDTWKVTDNLNTMTNIYIYDRFGKVIANILPNTEGWDGTYGGKPLFKTDYWYLIEFNTGDVLRGHFSLVK